MKKRCIQLFEVLITVTVVLSTSACGNSSNSSRDVVSKKETIESSKKEEVTIGYLPITHALPLFEVKEMLEDNNSQIHINLQKFSSWTDLTDALNAGKIDGASMLIELAMSAVRQGIDLKAVALGHKDGNVIVGSNDIKTGKDLKGKIIAIPSTQSTHNILVQEMLKKNALSLDDVTIVQLSPTEMPSSLVSKSIDAYCVAEPFGAQAVALNLGHVLYESNELWQDSICCALVVNQAFIAKKKEAYEEFYTFYMQAGKQLNHAESLLLATNYLGQKESILEESMQWISYDNLELTKDEYDNLREKMIAYGINTTPPSYDDFVYQQN